MGRKSLALVLMIILCAACLSGCGGQEIGSFLFVLSMAVDPAPDGNLTVTVKALSGTQEAGGSRTTEEESEGEDGAEKTEPGYIVLSATAPSCLHALNLLSGTTPRTVNLSQLREVVISRTLAETDAAHAILKEIYAMYRANGEAIVVVTPDDAGDFIRRQRAILGVRLSQYLDVLFEHFSQQDTIPPHAQLASVIAAMESGTTDAAVVYAAHNAFDSPLVLPGTPQTDRLPGHLPRTSPAGNEYLGSALFSGSRMTGVLTGEETGILCLLMGKAQRRTAFIASAQYKTNLRTRVKKTITADGALFVSVRMSLTRIAGSEAQSGEEIAAQIERQCVSVLRKLQAASCDAAGFGAVAVRRYADMGAWRAYDWQSAYENAPVQATAHVKVM